MAGPDVDATAPVAAYHHADVHQSGHTAERLIRMQHGSYHIGDVESQPWIDRDEAVRYRGIQTAEIFTVYS